MAAILSGGGGGGGGGGWPCMYASLGLSVGATQLKIGTNGRYLQAYDFKKGYQYRTIYSPNITPLLPPRHSQATPYTTLVLMSRGPQLRRLTD